MLAKPGVLLEGTHPWLIYAAQVYDWLHRQSGFGEATVTGGQEAAPGRARDTLHPTGQALDFRIWQIPAGQRRLFVQLLQYWLGQAFDVVLERDHIHVELSPAALAYLDLVPTG